MADHRPDESSPADFRETAERSREAGLADESAAYVAAGATSSEDEEDESEIGAQSSEKPAEGDEETAPPHPGSPE